MDFAALSREVGVAELVRVVDACASDEARAEAARFLPLVSGQALSESCSAIAAAVAGSGWRKVLLLSPEVMLMEELARRGFDGRLVVCLAREVDEGVAERIRRNVPPGIAVEFIGEGAFPANFLPGECAVVALGVGDERRACIPATTLRMLEYYASFSGSRVLACLAAGSEVERPFGWAERTTTDLFNTLIKGGE